MGFGMECTEVPFRWLLLKSPFSDPAMASLGSMGALILLWELFAVGYFPTVPLFLRIFTDLNWLMVSALLHLPRMFCCWRRQLCLLWSLGLLPLRVSQGRGMALAADTMGLSRQQDGSVGSGSSYSCCVRGRSAIHFLVTHASHKLACCFFSTEPCKWLTDWFPLSLFVCLAGRNVLTLWMSSPSLMAWYVGI